ncbi:MAG: LPS-assembly protein LptD [Candidatus Omnitrophica bacterium]|nr:LPS-assembly protein LptD [Candidatus Omnitrophota bacterium]
MTLRKNLIPFLVLIVPGLLGGTARAADAPSGDPIKVLGETVEYFHEEQKVIGTGNVKIDYEDTLLTADKITVYTETGQALAEGNVTLVQKDNTYKGPRGEYNFKTHKGRVEQMDAQFGPLYGKARQVERVDEGHFRATDGYVTTCCGDNPFYKIQSKQVDIHPGQKVTVRNAMLVVRGVPILFIPYYTQHFVNFDRFPVELVPGKDSEWGMFLLSRWRYQLGQSEEFSSKGNVLVDWREENGLGGGFENIYKGKRIGRGAIRAYYIDDKDAPDHLDSDRYRVQWRHQLQINEYTQLTAEYHKLSDADMTKDFFFREEYERDVNPDTYVSLVVNRPEYGLMLLDRERVNDFATVVERSPEVRYDTYQKPFQGTDIFYRQEVRAANLKKEFGPTEHQIDAGRIDTDHTLLYRAKAGPVSVTPRIGTRQTYYSRTLPNEDEEDAFRGTVDPGVDASVRFFKTYDVYLHKYGLDYNQVRHIFNPTVSYNFRPNPTRPRTVLQQFDAIDAIDKQHYLRFNFQNTLQTKEHDRGTLRSREIARIIPFFDMDYDTHHVENLGYDAELSPYPWLGIESDGLYNTHLSQWEIINADLNIRRGPFEFGIGQRFINDESNQTTAEVRWTINERWAVRVYERYDFERQALDDEFEITVSRAFDCIIMDFTYNHREGDTFFVAFRLKGFPKASVSLSQTYNRPKSYARPSQL